MADGDDAAAAGLHVYDGNEGAATIYVLLNQRGDEIAHVMTDVAAIVPIAKGGTGASTAAAARTALGAAATAHNHDASNITSGTISRPVSTTGTVNGSSIGVGGTGKGFDGAGNMYAAGGNFSGHIVSPAGRATPVTSSYVSAYFNGDGRLGIDPSARRFKRDIREHGYTLAQLQAIELVTYRLIEAVNEQGDEADILVGVIAEQLVEIGLGEFVVLDSEGAPLTVDYARLALVAIGALQEVAGRLDSIEARVKALEV